jgi:tRNA threonylcarbamoyladenosine biosynthesis protein TsaE
MNTSLAEKRTEKKPSPSFVFESKSEKETWELARDLGKELKGGDWILLIGDLGTGKTLFVQGLAEALGCMEVPRSPTFSLVQHYAPKPGRPVLHHADLYRVTQAEIPHLEWDDMMTDEGVTVIEWAEHAKHLWPKNGLMIRLAHAGGDARRLEFYSSNPRALDLVKKIKNRG